MTTRDYWDNIRWMLGKELLKAPEVDVGKWHAQDVSGNPMLISREVRHVHYKGQIPKTVDEWSWAIKPNLPWAEDHFLERVGGEPLNPPPSEAYWPFAVSGNAAHKAGDLFSHTYPERMWPRRAGTGAFLEGGSFGLRYRYGDYEDLVNLLAREPLTRQAYLPIWFPEDTGATSSQRLPCSIGYHFLMRDGVMDIVYMLRSCDFMRHWADDMYMTGRLLQHTVGLLRERGVDCRAGLLVTHISSLHVFNGDMHALRNKVMAWSDLDDENDWGAPV